MGQIAEPDLSKTEGHMTRMVGVGSIWWSRPFRFPQTNRSAEFAHMYIYCYYGGIYMVYMLSLIHI